MEVSLRVWWILWEVYPSVRGVFGKPAWVRIWTLRELGDYLSTEVERRRGTDEVGRRLGTWEERDWERNWNWKEKLSIWVRLSRFDQVRKRLVRIILSSSVWDDTGKTLAFTRVELTSLSSGKLLAYGTPGLHWTIPRINEWVLSFDDGVRTGSHTKYIKDALAGKENVKISEDGESLLEGVSNRGNDQGWRTIEGYNVRSEWTRHKV